MRFRVLGELQVEADGRVVPIRRARERSLLAALLLHANETVSRTLLIDEVWGEAPPASARHTLEGYVSRLRGALRGGEPRLGIETHPGGYRLRVEPADLDAAEFGRLVEEGRAALAAGTTAAAEETLRAALSLWRGDVLAGVPLQPLARAAADRLEELRLVAVEMQLDAKMRLGRHSELVPELEALVAIHPLRERLRAQLMLALYRSGRQADALEVYQQGWSLLVGELGIEPAPELQELQQAILRQDEQLRGRSERVPGGKRPRPPVTLPAELTSFVGREQELAQLDDLFRRARLVTVTGLGGIGKTRLALHAAAQLASRYPDGVYHVDASSVASTEELVSSLARALGVQLEAYLLPVDAKSQLFDFVERRSLLLVIDNFEHLVGSSDVLRELVHGARGVAVLVTSRERLNVREEWVLPLEGLPYADEPGGEPPAAIRLCIDRERQVAGRIPSSPAHGAAVARICRLVEGSPLGVELAAAWCSTLACSEIADEIERSLDTLTASSAHAPSRHRSLRAVFDSSWSFLDSSERTALAKLAVFSSGFRRGAADEVAQVGISTLARLVSKSLLRHSPDGRFDMPESIRRYAEERLSRDDYRALRERHATYYTAFMRERAAALVSDRPAAAMEEVLADLANVRLAVLFAVAEWDERRARDVLLALRPFALTQNPAEAATLFDHIVEALESRGASLEHRSRGWLPLAAALAWKGYFDSFRGETAGESRLRSNLTVFARSALHEELAVSLLALGIASVFRGDHEDAVRSLERSLRAAREADDAMVEAACLLWLGWAHQEGGDCDRAGRLYEEARKLAERRGYALVHAYALSKLAMWSDRRAEHRAAYDYHRRALAEFDALGNTAGHALAVTRMSISALALGDLAEAERLARRSLEEFTQIGHRWGIPAALCRIGSALLAQEATREAQASFVTALQLAQASEMVALELDALVGLAAVRARAGELVAATRLLTLVLEHPAAPEDVRQTAQVELRAATRTEGSRLRAQAKRWVDTHNLAEAAAYALAEASATQPSPPTAERTSSTLAPVAAADL